MLSKSNHFLGHITHISTKLHQLMIGSFHRQTHMDRTGPKTRSCLATPLASMVNKRPSNCSH